MLSRKFWNWKSDDGQSTLYIDGAIAEESWYEDDVTPKEFRRELFKQQGDIVVWINSPGGDCIAASQIYTMLREFPGKVTVKIDGLAASAASVVAMAGDEVLMSPTALMMVHNPLTVAIGDSSEMKKAMAMLSEIKESIINAYELKTDLSRMVLSNYMDAETWFDANRAVELGFCDGMLDEERDRKEVLNMQFSRRAVTNSLVEKLGVKSGQPIENVMERLDLIKKHI